LAQQAPSFRPSQTVSSVALQMVTAVVSMVNSSQTYNRAVLPSQLLLDGLLFEE